MGVLYLFLKGFCYSANYVVCFSLLVLGFSFYFFNLNMLLHFNSYSENVSWKKQEKEFKIYFGLSSFSSSSSSCPDSWWWKHRPVLLSFLLAHSYELKIFNLWRRNFIDILSHPYPYVYVKVIRRWSSHLISEIETYHWIQTD